MIFIKQLGEYIQDRTDLTLGVDLFLGEMIRDTNGVYMVERGGEEPDRYTPVEYCNIDFFVIDENSEHAYNRLNELYEFLHQRHHYNLLSYTVHFSHALGRMDDLDRSAENKKIFRQGFRFIVSPVIS